MLDAAFADAIKAAGITIEYDKKALNKARKSISEAIKADIEELQLPQYSWIVQKLEEPG